MMIYRNTLQYRHKHRIQTYLQRIFLTSWQFHPIIQFFNQLVCVSSTFFSFRFKTNSTTNATPNPLQKITMEDNGSLPTDKSLNILISSKNMYAQKPTIIPFLQFCNWLLLISLKNIGEHLHFYHYCYCPPQTPSEIDSSLCNNFLFLWLC